MASVTAGLMWAPVMPPATYTPMTTAIAHPQVMSSQSPDASKILVPRPDWLRAATAMATTPSPKAIRTMVPRNSAIQSPPSPFKKPDLLAILSRVSWVLAISVTLQNAERAEELPGQEKKPTLRRRAESGTFPIVSRSALVRLFVYALFGPVSSWSIATG